MRNICAILLFSTFTFSCNQIKEEDNVPTSKVEMLTSLEETEDTTNTIATETKTAVKETESVTTQSQEITGRIAAKPLLIARGFEPGWYAEFFSDRVKLQLDHGEINTEIKYDFSNIDKDQSYKVSISEVIKENRKAVSQKFSVHIEMKECEEEASGQKRERSITLSYNSKTYSGCATRNVN